MTAGGLSLGQPPSRKDRPLILRAHTRPDSHCRGSGLLHAPCFARRCNPKRSGTADLPRNHCPKRSARRGVSRSKAWENPEYKAANFQRRHNSRINVSIGLRFGLSSHLFVVRFVRNLEVTADHNEVPWVKNLRLRALWIGTFWEADRCVNREAR